MTNGDDSFTMSMLPASHSLRFAIEQANPAVVAPPPRETPTSSPQHRFTAPRETNLADQENRQSLINSIRSAVLTPQETETCLQSLSSLMNGCEESDAASFKEVILKLNESEFHRMASLLTSNSDYYFLEIARNKNGVNRLLALLGKSDDADTFFLASILRHFVHVVTDKHARHVAIQGLRVFSMEKKMELCNRALDLAYDQDGRHAVHKILNNLYDVFSRNYLLHKIALDALFLSYDAWGNFVIQHVLELRDLHCTRTVALKLYGICVELSFTIHGRYIVEKLLNMEVSMVMVVAEFLQFDGHTLARLATSVNGHFVVEKALRVTQVMNRIDLFWGLANKLRPFLHLLRESRRGGNISAFLERFITS